MKKTLNAFTALLLAAVLSFGLMPSCFAYDSGKSFGLTDPVHRYLENSAVMGYKYSGKDDYYYCDSQNSWQRNFGYNRVYDLVAPYVLLEYDYARVHFNYEGKNWLIQFWKGQYGLVFYGSEVGVYTKTATQDNDTYLTQYDCASQDDCLKIQTNMYHDKIGDGNYVRELSTPSEKTWWSTGFKRGHLRREEPATELRQTGTVTLKSAKMTQVFADAFEECGFKKVSGKGELTLDSFYIDDCTVHYIWQNNTQAENTMPIKIAAGTLMFLNFATVMSALAAIIGGMFAMGMLSLFIFI